MQVENTVVGGVAWVILPSDLDSSMLDRLDVALENTPRDGTRFQIDLSQPVSADTAGVRGLAASTAAARADGHDVKTFGVNRTFRNVAAVLHVQDDLGRT